MGWKCNLSEKIDRIDQLHFVLIIWMWLRLQHYRGARQSLFSTLHLIPNLLPYFSLWKDKTFERESHLLHVGKKKRVTGSARYLKQGGNWLKWSFQIRERAASSGDGGKHKSINAILGVQLFPREEQFNRFPKINSSSITLTTNRTSISDRLATVSRWEPSVDKRLERGVQPSFISISKQQETAKKRAILLR